jgi:hypothetical protein
VNKKQWIRLIVVIALAIIALLLVRQHSAASAALQSSV